MALLEEIKDAVSTVINAEFNTGETARYEIYTEEIKQGMVEPCFFIQFLEPEHMHYFWDKYFETIPLCIQYFPESYTDYQAECADVIERLEDALEYVTCEGDDRPIRGTKMQGEVVDGMLNFMVNYDMFTVKQREKTYMENIQIDQRSKE